MGSAYSARELLMGSPYSFLEAELYLSPKSVATSRAVKRGSLSRFFQKLWRLHEVYASSLLFRALFLAAPFEMFALSRPLPFHYASSRLFMGLPDILAAQINTHQSICLQHPILLITLVIYGFIVCL